jgi:hypothetical protein
MKIKLYRFYNANSSKNYPGMGKGSKNTGIYIKKITIAAAVGRCTIIIAKLPFSKGLRR